jgi:hypothetical protein
MPLDPDTAKTTLGAMFAAPPATEAAAAAEWANALEDLTTGIVPPSTTVAAAKVTFQAALVGFGLPGAAAAVLEAALVTFAATVGDGMSATHTDTPPIAPVGLLFPTESDAQNAADAIIDILDTWFKTGTATPNAGGSPVNWS